MTKLAFEVAFDINSESLFDVALAVKETIEANIDVEEQQNQNNVRAMYLKKYPCTYTQHNVEKL